jgi:hypothetical protein
MNILNWTIELNEPAHFVNVTAQGDFTLEDYFELKKDFISQDYWHPGMNVQIDYRQTIFTNLNLNILRKMGDFHKSKNEQIGNGRMVLLMKSPRDFGLARQYEMVTDGKVLSKVRVFLDENEALEWLTATSAIV